MKPYYDEDGVTIYHGDAREILPHMSYDFLVTDPPYANGTEYGAYEDTDSNLDALIDWFSSYLYRGAAVTPGIQNMWRWPEPYWTLCWYSGNGKGSSVWGFNTWQPILVYGKDPYLTNGLGRRPDGFNIHLGPYNLRSNGHPCPKPPQVMKWIIQRVTVASGVIVDPFMGSGTTLFAARELGHQAVGIEVEERYCEIAVDRLRQGVLPFTAPSGTGP